MPTNSPPLDDAAIPSAAAAEEPATAPSVLIVDDEEGIRNFLSRSLERRGWRVTTTGSAEDAALHLERHCVDLIILDIALLVHATSAVVLISSIIVHVYAALWVQGTIRAMVEGVVTHGWARKHHPRWYRETTGKKV
ncbi:response regulator [Azospirillum melinis]|uniref:Response regulator n=2 Tax=Azospirillum melinis TaxID=328839 RepID=A0ABX2KBI8_9PROT|nr:response regulator [Azospirillum melinis]NUB00980.1 response regulator [Azospirillum melinis]